ncbi:unnamed protein product [Trifolium pratense]|uniref:Uncharacterized protein n=1 Tax=Trifolium pratense TaxID=57577 RepID=A0ACB0JEE3_TRIPR|nr:unnamed protein product [Trifolium pratense]
MGDHPVTKAEFYGAMTALTAAITALTTQVTKLSNNTTTQKTQFNSSATASLTMAAANDPNNQNQTALILGQDSTHFESLITNLMSTSNDHRSQAENLFNLCKQTYPDSLLDMEDDPAWHAALTEDEDAGETTNYGFGQECLDKLSISLGGNTIVPVASELLPTYLVSPEWQKHNAALVAITQIAEGCSKVMTKNLEHVLSMVLNSFSHPHPRVRWTAINAIGQLSTDLGPDLQVKYHHLVLSALAGAMDDFENARVQAHVASAVLNFTENCTPDILIPRLDVLTRDRSSHFIQWDPGGWSLVHWRSQPAKEAFYQDENSGTSSFEVEETDVGGFLVYIIILVRFSFIIF